MLCWAALSGRFFAMIGRPPRQSFPAPLRHDGVNEHYQKEIQLITRMMTLWYIAEEGRCMAWRQGRLGPSVQKPHVGFLLEHPDGSGREDRFSFFETPLWRAFSLEALMGEIRFSMNGRPTVLGVIWTFGIWKERKLGHYHHVIPRVLCGRWNWWLMWLMRLRLGSVSGGGRACCPR